MLEHPGALYPVPPETGLYLNARARNTFASTPTTLRLIPYYAWANREPSAMQVWVPYRFA